MQPERRRVRGYPASLTLNKASRTNANKINDLAKFEI